jgi:hypothetical protein
MLWHEHKRVQLEFSLPPIRVERLQEEPRHGFGDEQASSLPGDRRYEISSRGRYCARQFQKLTSAAEAGRSRIGFGTTGSRALPFFAQESSMDERESSQRASSITVSM